MSLQATDLRARMERTFGIENVRRVERDEHIGDPQQRKRDNPLNGKHGAGNTAVEDAEADTVDVSGSYREARTMETPVPVPAVESAEPPCPAPSPERHLDIKV